MLRARGALRSLQCVVRAHAPSCAIAGTVLARAETSAKRSFYGQLSRALGDLAPNASHTGPFELSESLAWVFDFRMCCQRGRLFDTLLPPPGNQSGA